MATANQHPEQAARDRIDDLLIQAGWSVQSANKLDWGASLGVAIREYPTDTGPADYVLFVARQPVGIVEAKRDEEGLRLTMVETQSAEYADSKLKYLNHQPLPFIYESTGILTRFTDRRDPKPRSRPVFWFHRPEMFQGWLKQDRSLRGSFGDLPELDPAGLRDCQVTAIENLERSFQECRPRALIQMATGSGKTFTAVTAIYRLLKFAKAQRVLFLVDTKNLGEQAETEFIAYQPSDDNRKFTELYNVQRLQSSHIATDSQVCISTIQRLYAMLKGEDLDEGAERDNPNELVQPKTPMPVVYSPKIPIEFFDFIVIDECHRSIYNIWKQVLEYFDGFLIGLTATPDSRTFGFFNQNVVSEYSHEDAVGDGVNVGHDVYTIETEISQNGSKIVAKEFVDKREMQTRRTRWEQLDNDVAYTSRQLDRDVVNPSQIRTIIRTFKDKLPEIFPGREEVPKTLIFAKTDSHADDIIQIVREEFGEGNAFCKKVTYRSTENPKSVLAQFRNDFYPRVAVTVDMIATGTDVKPLECLLFMRDVKSSNYFDQMKGRGTRTLGYDDLKKVTPSAVSAKTHFVVVDAIGVTKSLKTSCRPLEQKHGVSLKDLMTGIMMGARDEAAFVSLANRLARIDRQITPQERERVQQMTGGKTIGNMVQSLLAVYDLDRAIDRARLDRQLTNDRQPTDEQIETASLALAEEAAVMFKGELIEYLDNVRRVHEQLIDNVNLDRVEFAGWHGQAQEQAVILVEDFAAYLAAHRDEITALQVFYNLPYQRRSVTYGMVEELLERMREQQPQLAPLRVWKAYEQLEQVNGRSPKSELTALVALVRRVVGIDEVLTSYETTVNRNFQDWVFRKQAGALKFSDEQMEWLRLIKDHVVSSFHLEPGDLDYAPFDARGGIGRMYQLFGDEMDEIIQDINEGLAA